MTSNPDGYIQKKTKVPKSLFPIFSMPGCSQKMKVAEVQVHHPGGGPGTHLQLGSLRGWEDRRIGK